MILISLSLEFQMYLKTSWSMFTCFKTVLALLLALNQAKHMYVWKEGYGHEIYYSLHGNV